VGSWEMGVGAVPPCLPRSKEMGDKFKVLSFEFLTLFLPLPNSKKINEMIQAPS